MENSEYFNAEALVSTEWVSKHMSDPSVRIVESNEDPLLYRSGHLPSAVEIDWVRDLNHPVKRDYVDRKMFEDLLSRCGITEGATVVFYGDRSNWWAAYAYWVFRLFGYGNLKLMDGGRAKWEKEGRTMVRQAPEFARSIIRVRERDDATSRAFRDQVLEHIERALPLVDVRSFPEFTGEKLHMEGYPNEGALRGGHIPGAKSCPWARAVDESNGTFKSVQELRKLYEDELGLRQTDDVIVYCRIGERSSHTWFVLTELLGFQRVRNYDGSWTEWGNLVGVPVAKGSD